VKIALPRRNAKGIDYIMSSKSCLGDSLAVRVSGKMKSDFVSWCDGAGLSATGAVNLFIKAVLRCGQIPFPICACDIKDLDNNFSCPCGEHEH